MSRWLLLPLLMLVPATRAAAQQRLDLSVGDRIRIDSPEGTGRTVTARVEASKPEWIAFRVEGDASELTWTRRLASVDTMRVSRGDPRWQAARWGGAWGVYLGASSGAIAGLFLARSSGKMTSLDSAARVGVGGGLAGVLLGAAVGALRAPEHWRTYLLRHPAETPAPLPVVAPRP